jgi:hypothetical protein
MLIRDRVSNAGIELAVLRAMIVTMEGKILPLEWEGFGRLVSVWENLRINIKSFDVNDDCRSVPFVI